MKHAVALEKAINEAFKEGSQQERIEFVSQKDQGVSGNFEVTIGGVLVHSKKTRGEGFPSADASLEKVLDAIETALE